MGPTNVPILNDMLRKIGEAIRALPRIRKRKCEKLIMTLLVKNEEKLLEHNLLFHHMMGVDSFIVTDNNSTDRTPEILDKYKKKGWIVELIQEPGTNYLQKKWVDRMVNLARRKYRADWIINADADEFWYSPDGNLKVNLGNVDGNVVYCESKSMYPIQDKPFTEWNEIAITIPDHISLGLSRYAIFSPQRGKVAHRADGYLQIGMGNHKVAMFPHRKRTTNIRIYHYNVQERESFIAKMENGGRQFENHPTKKHGRHWRYYYELYKQGKLSEEYDRVIGTKLYESLKREGHIVSDSTMVTIFAKLITAES